MRVVITGGAGFLGRKLADRLLAANGLRAGNGPPEPVDELVLLDAAGPAAETADPRVEWVVGDLTEPETVAAALGEGAGAVFHLAAVVSAGAEADFDLGMRVNLDGTRVLLEACRRLPRPPRLVFASSLAVFGGDVPETIDDRTILTPQTSYGTQKAIAELLINDYSRKGFIDGRVLRLPTVVVRPGLPNRAASGFASSIIREPLQGREAVCPVRPEQEMWIISPRRVVEAFVHAYGLPPEVWGGSRSVSLPGITRTVAQMVEAMTVVAGQGPSTRIRWERDPSIERIVAGWPARFDTAKADSLGFRADESMEAIVRGFVEDELGGRIA